MMITRTYQTSMTATNFSARPQQKQADSCFFCDSDTVVIEGKVDREASMRKNLESARKAVWDDVIASRQYCLDLLGPVGIPFVALSDTTSLVLGPIVAAKNLGDAAVHAIAHKLNR
jgi:hypothetical protein